MTGQDRTQAPSPKEHYLPDIHPLIRENLVTITTPEGSSEYVPREVFEKVVKERDDLNRTMAMISAEYFVGVELDIGALLAREGHGAEQGEATASIIRSVQSSKRDKAADSGTGDGS